jgi:hypothetical protein
MCNLTTKDIIARIRENEKKREKLKELGKRVSDHLGVEEIPIEFVELNGEVSRLVLKPSPKIQVTDHTYLKYEFLASCIAHEYRHAFQLYWVNLMNDKLAEVWREELQDAKNSENIDPNNLEEYSNYKMQAIEIDAEAFAIYYLRTFENINIKRKEVWLQNLIEAYIKKYRNRL